MNKLQAMEVFIQVVDCGSFTKAAEMLNLPKATVSTLVQTLETTLSVKLLHRTTRQVMITSDGAAYYERCIQILSDVRDAEESLSRHRLSPSGRLRVDSPTGLSSEILIPALPAFFERYPDITMELGSTDRVIDLVEEGVDCAVRGGELLDQNLIARRIGVINFVTCASPAYLERHGMPQHPRDLERHRCVNYFSAKTGKILNWDFTRDGERIEVALPGAIALNDSNAYVQAGLAGLGVIMMTDYLLIEHITAGRMVQVLPDWSIDPLPVHIVYPQNRHLSAKVRVFVEWVSELFAGHPNLRLQAPKAVVASSATVLETV
ncbi:LysR family transcriptional regulator [Telluria aromaticivorans]|uniref:LysR family transcriptional regulator n=1 Tax=Telluria aromaticivorans TaxID=2725995 RepID=A0A7Y2K2B9_9BURK|nr:LysR family transcriptional regulator [Telluria aromaticivorans]NNG25266.1 LysR family transcriptional regulator [Telluria aromaticivorans]